MSAVNGHFDCLVWKPVGQARLKAHAAVDLRQMLVGGRRLLLVGRNSTSGSQVGARAAAKDLYGAADLLATRFGYDVRDCLPKPDQVARDVMGTTPLRSVDPQGRAFINRFAVYEVQGTPLVLSVSAGSALKLDENDMQPHAEHLRNLILDSKLNIGGLYLKRADRGTRDTWSANRYMGPLGRLRKQGEAVWAASGGREYALTDSDDIQVFVEGWSGHSEAAVIQTKQLQGARSGTGTQPDERGWINWAVGRAVPPGLMRFTVKATGRSVLTYDTPSQYPSQELAASVLPSVYDQRGQRVDQVELVRDFWRLLPELGVNGAMRSLVERRYSTQSLRDQRDRDASAYYGSDDDPLIKDGRGWDAASSWARSLLRNIDFYRTGEFKVRLGPGEADIVITDVFPPDGPWMDEKTMQEVQQWMDNRTRLVRAPAKWSWSGFPITVDGLPGTLRPPHDPDARDVRWRIAPDGGGSEGTYPPLPDRVLMDALKDALIEADGQPLRALVEDNADPELAAMQAKFDVLERNETVGRRKLEARRLAIFEVDESGAFEMPKALRKVEMEAWERENDQLQALVKEKDALAANMHEMRRAVGVEAQTLERILHALEDPRSSPMREALRRAVSKLVIESRDIKVGRLRGRRLLITGNLVVAHGGRDYAIPVSTHFDAGVAADAPRRVALMVNGMRHGQPLTFVGERASRVMTPLTAALGTTPRAFALARCEDSAILRIGMAAMHPDAVDGEDGMSVPTLDAVLSDPELVRDFGDTRTLADNIVRTLSAARTSRWVVLPGARYETHAILLGAGVQSTAQFESEQAGIRALRQQACQKSRHWRYKRWTFPLDGGRPAITPCVHCGGRLCFPARIREVSGFLCLSCRRDESGVTWPQRFDRYLSNIDMLVAADVAEPPALPPKRSAPKGPRWRRREDLSAAEVDAIASAYLDKSQSLRSIEQGFGVPAYVVHRIRDERGLPHRNRGWEKRD